MNERSMHGGPSPHGAPAAAPVRHAPNAYDQPLAQVSWPSRPMAREPLPATGRDPEVTAERSDGYWFRQWVDAPRGGSEDDMAGTGSLSGQVNLEGGEVEAFVDQLSPRLQATLDQQLDLLLHLPHLGRIRVTAQPLGSHPDTAQMRKVQQQVQLQVEGGLEAWRELIDKCLHFTTLQIHQPR